MPKFLALLGFLVLPNCSELLGQERADTAPPPQIMIEVRIVERDLKDGYCETISRPQITATELETAAVNVGLEPAIIGGNLTIGYYYPKLGIHLQVTPRIMPDEKIQLRVVTDVRARIPQQVSVGQTLETVLTAPNGQTVFTKGIQVSERTVEEKKIPWLGDVPIVGGVFRKRVQSVSRSEVIVFLRPHITHIREEADRIRQEGPHSIEHFMNKHWQDRDWR
jgi:type II secretory pathway component GspD/PulD (secretin)